MSYFQVETTQNVQLNYRLAPLSRRISAKLIDGLILGSFSFLMSLFLSRIHLTDWTYILLIVLPVLLYPLLTEWALNGQTFGKMARDIRVIKADGTPATLSSFIIRWLIGIIEVQMVSGALALVGMLFTHNGQRFGDLAAKTVVVYEEETEDLSQTIFRKVDENYVITFPQAEYLTDEDATLIQEVLNRYTYDDWERGTELANKLSNKLKEKLQIDSQLHNFKFLQTLLRDFNHITAK